MQEYHHEHFCRNILMRFMMGISSRDFMTLLSLYMISHGWLLYLGEAVYWDDWSLIGASSEQIFNTFSEAGSFFNFGGWLHFTLLNFGPFIYKALTLPIFFYTGILVYKITARDICGNGVEFWVSLLYLISPLYIGRVVLIDFPYTLSVLFFYMGWWAIPNNRLISLTLFFLSFNTQSLLVFYCIPMYFMLRKVSQRNFLKYIVKNLDFFTLPFIWFLLKNIFYKPFGNYSGYNENFDLRNLISAPYLQLRDFYDFLYSHLYSKLSILLIFIFLICIILVTFWNHDIKENKNQSWKIFLFGVLSLWCGLFPYWILGHVPTFDGWTSRHQLLMPLGCSLIIVGFLGLIRLTNYSFLTQKVPLGIIISSCFIINFNHYQDLRKEWETQINIINFLKSSPIVRESTLILFDNRGFKAFDQRYAFYEWNGILHQAIPINRDKFGIEIDELGLYQDGKFDKEFKRFFITQNHIKSVDKVAVVKITRINEVDFIVATPFEILHKK
jgi:hypothetical protein